MVLFIGKFDALFGGHLIKIHLTIRDNYECNASFEYLTTCYTFNMRKWAKTKENGEDEAQFEFFASLILEEFYETTFDFGTIDSGNVVNYNKLNILQYSASEVFKCADEILSKYKDSLSKRVF
jgi:repressor of nif and glnA expression